MGCQKAIVDKIKQLKTRFLICLKDNQNGPLEEVEAVFTTGLAKYPDELEVRRYQSPVEKGHGRIESWEIILVNISPYKAREWVTKAERWAGFSTIVMVTHTFGGGLRFLPRAEKRNQILHHRLVSSSQAKAHGNSATLGDRVLPLGPRHRLRLGPLQD